MFRKIFILLLFLSCNSLFAKNQDHTLFEGIFSEWTNAFNQKDLTKTCALFSPHLTANYQGSPPKTYESICQGFKKIFNEAKQYHYSFKLHQIYRIDDLAAVRVTWYLKVTKDQKLLEEVKDEGLDVFQRDNQGQWKIVNYLGYPTKT